jgi:hypothetical protein
MRYALQVLINNLDGTTEEKDSVLPSPEKLLDAIYHVLCEYEDFAASLTFRVVPKR